MTIGNSKAENSTSVQTNQTELMALFRIKRVLELVPISRAGWWAGVKAGRYPAPVRIGSRCVAWRSQDIAQLIASF